MATASSVQSIKVVCVPKCYCSSVCLHVHICATLLAVTLVGLNDLKGLHQTKGFYDSATGSVKICLHQGSPEKCLLHVQLIIPGFYFRLGDAFRALFLFSSCQPTKLIPIYRCLIQLFKRLISCSRLAQI